MLAQKIFLIRQCSEFCEKRRGPWDDSHPQSVLKSLKALSWSNSDDAEKMLEQKYEMTINTRGKNQPCNHVLLQLPKAVVECMKAV